MDTITTTAMIFLIMIGAYIFGYFLSVSNCPTELANWVSSLSISPYIVLAFILLLYAILGCFVDSCPDRPARAHLPANHQYFGLQPDLVRRPDGDDHAAGPDHAPVGMCCYVMAGVAKDVPLATIFRGTAPFIVGLLLAVLITILVPELALFLPTMMQA
jgi:TRAP-type C4-dicarboxylate transport system permease large subunit